MSEQDWFWCTDYCQKNGLPPAQSWAWDKAKAELDKHKTEREDGHERI